MIFSLDHLKTYRSILCLNGLLPEFSFFYQVSLPIIAADGAANLLHDIGIFPSKIIGDLDSLYDDLRKEKSILIHDADQSRSDFQKALAYLGKNDLLPAIILGMHGGYLDHILNNINIFLETNCIFYAPPIWGCIIKDNRQEQFALPINTKISFMGIPHACVSSQGLKWELNQTKFSFPGPQSFFNRTLYPEINIAVHQGSLLVLIYEEAIHDAGC